MVFDWSTDQDQLFLMHYYIDLVKGCSDYFFFLGLLESSITWPCLLFWYTNDADSTLAKWQKIPFTNADEYPDMVMPRLTDLYLYQVDDAFSSKFI